ncbi:quinone-dependent dihydroorotate dehydrogenase [Aquipuribacter nitratireducens]|uniref:Dihydroorotate dehydrogenase (quinone) n=1 Tax=Aquipuribacter nitratireducens TaxID=650104 RepID=A0ABW0GTZ2_9MICO
MYRLLFRTVLVRLDAERAHVLGVALVGLLGRLLLAVPGGIALARRVTAPGRRVPVRALGLDLPGPLGVAAGLDKDARAVAGLAALGFDVVEVGTVTAHSQPGNPRPRLFRLPRDRAVLNRMGFNNSGADAVRARLERLRAHRGADGLVVGVNIGRTKAVADDAVVADYTRSAHVLGPVADYLVVNVSSPNTPGLRDLQAVDTLRPLLLAVREAADAAAGRHVPLLVKIAPDLADADVLAVADLALELGLDGIVATNTTIARDGLGTPAADVAALGAGGVSGPPVASRATEVLRLLAERCAGRLTLVGAGGVTTAGDVADRLAAGASLVQAYTAFVYEGPGWPRRVHRDLARQESA